MRAPGKLVFNSSSLHTLHLTPQRLLNIKRFQRSVNSRAAVIRVRCLSQSHISQTTNNDHNKSLLNIM